MKKAAYILIIIASIGLLSPVTAIHAAPQTGPCPVGQAQDPNGTGCIPIAGAPTPTPAGSYTLLSPLPCTTPGTGGCTDKGLTTFDLTQTNNLGTYLNIMIRIFIGLCAVLAVIMIVVGGIEYMTSELASRKEAGKERITGAIFGLLLALGAYALLFTVNPDLLNTDLKTFDSATVNVTILQEDLDSGPPSLSVFSGALPTGKAAACTTGVVQSQATHIVACSSISAQVDQLMADAKQAGFSMFAGGFRTIAEQTALRQQNCNGNTTDKTAVCNPATALPGSSRHESGLAFDLACNGSTITSTSSPCFTWLQANASKYGLQNLVTGKEPWHWSIDGH